jgi:hypothetical protein
VVEVCQFEDWPIISKYTCQDAIEDGVLNEVYHWRGKPVVSTAGINQDFELSEILTIFNRFKDWKKNVEPTLAEEDRLFSTEANNAKVWVIEDGESYTILYPHEY